MIQFLFIGTTELLLISGIALLLFGGKKLPEMMRGLGQGVKQFKEGMKDINPMEEAEEPEHVREILHFRTAMCFFLSGIARDLHRPVFSIRTGQGAVIRS